MVRAYVVRAAVFTARDDLLLEEHSRAAELGPERV
jgi:hypothetical protein